MGVHMVPDGFFQRMIKGGVAHIRILNCVSMGAFGESRLASTIKNGLHETTVASGGTPGNYTTGLLERKTEKNMR